MYRHHELSVQAMMIYIYICISISIYLAQK